MRTNIWADLIKQSHWIRNKKGNEKKIAHRKSESYGRNTFQLAGHTAFCKTTETLAWG